MTGTEEVSILLSIMTSFQIDDNLHQNRIVPGSIDLKEMTDIFVMLFQVKVI